MPLIIELILVFLRIGLFGFGGGFAILPFIQNEMISHDWLGMKEFANIVSIAQMTPGPLGINTATYVGYKVLGFWGSAAATLSLVAVPYALTLIIGHFYNKYKENQIVKSILLGIRPVTVAFILIAGLSFFIQTIFGNKIFITNINIIPFIIFAVSLFFSIRYKINPIYIIFGSALLGVIFL